MKLTTEIITPEHRFLDKINALALEAFPPEEYLSPKELIKMAQSDNFDFFALIDDENFVGFFAVQTHKDIAYLFFLAIEPSFRSMGYGSRAVETLKAIYPGKKQIVDFEMPDAAAPNYHQRKRRREFYLRCGYRETGLFLSYLGVDYEVFCMDDNFDADIFKEMMSEIRVEGFEPKYFTK